MPAETHIDVEIIVCSMYVQTHLIIKSFEILAFQFYPFFLSLFDNFHKKT